jgi:hypothetical protein
MGKSQKTPPQAVGLNDKAEGLEAVAPARAKLAQASSHRQVTARKPRRKAPGSFTRYITPEAIMQSRFGDNPRPEWDAAVLCFRSHEGSRLIAEMMRAKPLGYKVLWGMDEIPAYPLAHEFIVGKARVGLIARCLWGGPQTAIMVEELVHLGVKHLIGIGAAGSIAADLPRTTQIVATVALTTDGAETVNMEVAPFYAASAVCGVESVWIGHVSDCLANHAWEPWDNLEQMTAQSAQIGLDVLEELLCQERIVGGNV